MATVGSFGIDLGLNTARFEEGLRKAGRQADSFRNDFKAALGDVATAGKIAATAAAAFGAAFVASTKQAIDFASGIADASAAAGISTDAFQALGAQAGLAGVSTEEFGAAMTRANKSIGDAANGTGAAAKTFEQLGIAVRDTGGNVRPAEDVIRDFADGLAALPSPAEKAAAAAALFGKSAGPQMVAMLEQGSAGIDAFIVKAKDMGLVMSEQLIAKADKAGDDIDTLSRAISVQFYSALINVTPKVSQFANALREAGVGIGQWIAGLQGVDSGQTRLNRLADEITNLQAVIDQRAGTGAASTWLMEQLGYKSVEQMHAEMKVLQDDLARTAQGMGQSRPRTAGGKPVETGTPPKPPKAPKGDAPDPADFVGADAIRDALNTEEYNRQLQQAVDEQIRIADEGLIAVGEDARRSVEEVSGANVAIALDTFSQLQDIASTYAGQAADDIESILFAGFRDGTKGMLQEFRNVLVQMGIELARAKLKQALGNVFMSILGASSTGKNLPGADLTKSSVTAGSGLAKFASGGSFTVPGPSTGDKVVPIFRANGGETVTVTPKGQGGGSGVTIVQNISAPGATQETVALIRSESARAARSAVSEIINMRQRGRL